jgi:hypothetical protein
MVCTHSTNAYGSPSSKSCSFSYLEDFLAAIRKNGFVTDAIGRTGARGASAAP